jgi:hypothetical protein
LRRGRGYGLTTFLGHARQLTHNLRAKCHFNDPVINVSLDLGRSPQNHAVAGYDVTPDRPVQHNVPGFHITLNGAGLAYGQAGALDWLGPHIARDAAIEVQSAREYQIAIHAGCFPNEGIDPGLLGVAAKHGFSADSV